LVDKGSSKLSRHFYDDALVDDCRFTSTATLNASSTCFGLDESSAIFSGGGGSSFAGAQGAEDGFDDSGDEAREDYHYHGERHRRFKQRHVCSPSGFMQYKSSVLV